MRRFGVVAPKTRRHRLDSRSAYRRREKITYAWNSQTTLAGRLFDHLLRSQESYSQKWDYVRMNPVRAKLCDAAEDWPYQGEIVRIPFD